MRPDEYLECAKDLIKAENFGSLRVEDRIVLFEPIVEEHNAYRFSIVACDYSDWVVMKIKDGFIEFWSDYLDGE